MSKGIKSKLPERSVPFEPLVAHLVDTFTETLRLLVVSRDAESLRPLRMLAESNAWAVDTAASAWEAMDRIQSGVTPYLIVLDVPRGDIDSLHILRWLRRLRPEMPVILRLHPNDISGREDAIRLGADAVLMRPLQDGDLESTIRRLSGSRDAQEAKSASADVEPLGDDEFFVAGSPVMQKLRTQVELLARDDVPVLLLGERGSGKQTTARLMHRLSVRSGFTFTNLNCEALPTDLVEKEIAGIDAAVARPSEFDRGRPEAIEQGTILFHEFTEMPGSLQARLLDFLQREAALRPGSTLKLGTGARVLASSSANLDRALAEKKLRHDLHHHISAFTVHVPPLRQRKEDIPILLQHYMHALAKHYGLLVREFSPQVIELSEKYSWPGNISQLKAFVKRYLVAGDSEAVLHELDSQSSPLSSFANASRNGALKPDAEAFQRTPDSPPSLRAMIQDIKSETERNAIEFALGKTGWNRKAAARLLKVSYRTLLYKIDQYHMKSSESLLSPMAEAAHPFCAPGTKHKVS